MSNPIYSAKRPDQLLTFPPVRAFEIKRDFETITNLQSLGCSPFTIDLGQPDDTTTLIIRFSHSGVDYTLRVGNVLVLLDSGNYEKYLTVAAFLLDYVIQ